MLEFAGAPDGKGTGKEKDVRPIRKMPTIALPVQSPFSPITVIDLRRPFRQTKKEGS